jgi:hypothetical protein
MAIPLDIQGFITCLYVSEKNLRPAAHVVSWTKEESNLIYSVAVA